MEWNRMKLVWCPKVQGARWANGGKAPSKGEALFTCTQCGEKGHGSN